MPGKDNTLLCICFFDKKKSKPNLLPVRLSKSIRKLKIFVDFV